MCTRLGEWTSGNYSTSWAPSLYFGVFGSFPGKAGILEQEGILRIPGNRGRLGGSAQFTQLREKNAQETTKKQLVKKVRSPEWMRGERLRLAARSRYGHQHCGSEYDLNGCGRNEKEAKRKKTDVVLFYMY